MGAAFIPKGKAASKPYNLLVRPLVPRAATLQLQATMQPCLHTGRRARARRTPWARAATMRSWTKTWASFPGNTQPTPPPPPSACLHSQAGVCAVGCESWPPQAKAKRLWMRSACCHPLRVAISIGFPIGVSIGFPIGCLIGWPRLLCSAPLALPSAASPGAVRRVFRVLGFGFRV